ncbi:unnamed protein product [Clonostachys rosea]|uniref:Cytochrome b5 heme-binding domain-containing protein n=1 Tax=Bionectria ochroleuca TaxID=29856 RepID=A0ABY6UIU6_BIOOC|nr:unnamed protein product [Clonostachys rosea]
MIYDVSTFIESHPGGPQAILEAGGKDSSKLFTMLHSPHVLEILPAEACLGPVDTTTLPEPEEQPLDEEEIARQIAIEEMPEADNLFLLEDFEHWASQVLSKTAWAYYRSAADEERTFHENRDAFRRYFFRPRILCGAAEGSLETSIIGIQSSMPLFISPTAMARLGHPLGEVNLTRAASQYGVVQMISSNSSCTLEEIFDAREGDQPLMFQLASKFKCRVQLYLNRDRSASAALLKKVENLGAKAIVFTVDMAWDSKRTLDVRAKAGASMPSTIPHKKNGGGVAQAIGGYQDRNLTWKDISFIRRHTSLPIIVKGVQCIEDVQLCVDHGVEGVILASHNTKSAPLSRFSNHGGRQADYSPAPIDVLYEVRTLRPDLFEKIDIMIDGGIRCGADVVKALAMGAKAVGLGRPFLYANGTHGEEGVSRVLEILQEEITNTMRNIGVSRVEDLKPEMVGPAGPWITPYYARISTNSSRKNS